MNILLNGEKMEEVREFTYLGTKITEDGTSKRNIFSRMGQIKVLFNLLEVGNYQLLK